jgi:hypothetical protein
MRPLLGEIVAECKDSERRASSSNAPYGLLSSSFHMVLGGRGLGGVALAVQEFKISEQLINNGV